MKSARAKLNEPIVRVSGRIPFAVYEPFRVKLFAKRKKFQHWLVNAIQKETKP